MPRRVIIEQRLHLGGQRASSQISQRHDLKHTTKCCARGNPEITGDVGRLREFEVFWGSAVHVGQWSVYRSYDIGNRDLRSRSREPIAAVMSALTRHNAATSKLGEQAFGVTERHVLMVRYYVTFQARTWRKHGDLEHRSNRIVDGRGDAHIGILTRQPDREVALCISY
jgi:hypothetical protein